MSTTSTTIYTCDTCGNTFETDTYLSDEPLGWFSLYHVTGEDDDGAPTGETCHFCGPVCVITAAKKLLREVVA